MTDDPTLTTGHSSPAKGPLPILLILSCTIAWVIAQLSYNALPQLLEPIKETFGQSDEVVGRLYGYELFVFAVVGSGALPARRDVQRGRHPPLDVDPVASCSESLVQDSSAHRTTRGSGSGAARHRSHLAGTRRELISLARSG